MDEHKSQVVEVEQMVVFELNSEEYAVPITEVREIIKTIEITPVPQSPSYIMGIINLRGKIVPVLDLEEKFHLVTETKKDKAHIVIAEGSDNTLFGIVVDEVSGVLRIDPATIKPTPKLVESKIAAELLNGVIVIPETERILLILDVRKILTEKEVEIVSQSVMMNK